MNSKQKSTFFIISLLTLATHLLYAKTLGAGFIKDFLGFQKMMGRSTISDFFNCFGFDGLEHFTFLWIFGMLKIFGVNEWAWYLLFTSFHICNGFLFYLIGQQIAQRFQLQNSQWIAVGASLLFVISPYQNEPVVWKACMNFIWTSFVLLNAIHQLLKYLDHEKKQNLVGFYFFLIIALLSNGLSLIMPFASIIFVLFWKENRLKSHLVSPFFYKLIYPQFALLVGYFSLNKWWLGDWVGHYGAKVHLQFYFVQVAGNLLKYFTKYLVFLRDIPYEQKEWVNQVLEKPTVVWSLISILFVLFALAIFYFQKLPPRIKVGGLSLLLFFAFLIPAANLFVGWFFFTENDRYGYLACGFFFIFLMTLLTYLPKYLRWSIFLIYVGFSVFFTHRVTTYWKTSAEVYYSLLEDFRWEKEEKIYVLACPDNHFGVYMFKDYTRKSLWVKYCLEVGGKKSLVGNIQQVAQFNLVDKTAGVQVTQESNKRLTVTFNQWGNWWWRNGIGATEYETDEYIFTRAGKSYHLEFKDSIPDNAVFIYTNGMKWEEFFVKY